MESEAVMVKVLRRLLTMGGGTTRLLMEESCGGSEDGVVAVHGTAGLQTGRSDGVAGTASPTVEDTVVTTEPLMKEDLVGYWAS